MHANESINLEISIITDTYISLTSTCKCIFAKNRQKLIKTVTFMGQIISICNNVSFVWTKLFMRYFSLILIIDGLIFKIELILVCTLYDAK